jgi:hypothetical protein
MVGWDMQKNRETPNSPSSFLFLLHCDCLEGRLKPGGPPSKRRAAPRLRCQHIPYNARRMDIPMAAMMVTIASFPSLKAFSISLPRSVSGILTSSLEFPSPSIKLRKPCFVSRLYLFPSLDATHILNVDELVFGSGDVGDIHVVGLSSVFPPFPNSANDHSRRERYPRASYR